MNVLFQHLLFVSLNLHHTKVHVQHYEYVITSIIFTIYCYFLLGHQKSNVEVHCP